MSSFSGIWMWMEPMCPDHAWRRCWRSTGCAIRAASWLWNNTGSRPRILRLIQKWLKAGITEEGKWSETEMGTLQGSVISPSLANIYLHYVFDLWANVWCKKYAQEDMVVVRYADDSVLGFQHRTELDRFLEDFRERLEKFGLELHPDKTRRIEFGRFAEQKGERRGEGKVSQKHSTFWDSRISAGKTGTETSL